MTSKILSPNLTARLNEKFHDHPLLKTCQKAFRHYMASMDSFDFTSEELFAEAAIVLDEIFNAPEDAPNYLDGLWDNLKIKLKQKTQPVPPQADLDKVCGVLFYVVAATLSLHWRQYYRETLVNLLCGIVERKGVFSNGEEQEQIIRNLCAHAEDLDEWINQYDQSKEWLTDEIASAKPKKPECNKEDKKIRKHKEIINTSFLYKHKGIEIGIKNIRLTEVYEEMLNEELIPVNTDKKDFLDIFSGDETNKRIAWIGQTNILHYLFSEWVNRGYLTKPKKGLWTIVAARFYHREKNVDGGWDDREFTPNELRQAGNPKNPSDSLEQIIEMLKPDIRVRH